MFEFRKIVLEDLGYNMSQCKCDTFACMVFESKEGDYTVTTIFYKDNIFLKRQIITQQHILLTENTEEIIDMKNLVTYHPMYKNREILTENVNDVNKNTTEDIFGQDDYGIIAYYLNIERNTLMESLKSNFDGVIEIINNVLNGSSLAKIHKIKLQNALDNLMVIPLNH